MGRGAEFKIFSAFILSTESNSDPGENVSTQLKGVISKLVQDNSAIRSGPKLQLFETKRNLPPLLFLTFTNRIPVSR